MTAAGLIVAAPCSGAGKTTVTLGLLAALRRRGVAVRAAKSGPDYIDPAFHAAASGAPSVNLDSWAMPPALLDRLLASAAADGEILIIESAMGLFDGVDAPPGRSGAAADLAARYRLPVLLVLDIGGQLQSAAAVALGFALHRPDVRIGGVVLNRAASTRHHAQASAAIRATELPVLGGLLRDPALGVPKRHLGLVQAAELAGLAALIDRLADRVAAQLDLDAILELAERPAIPATSGRPALDPPGQRIALARDAAFSFVYPHLLADWRLAGAEILPFSPLANEAPDAAADICWLPGGYPELHAATLAAADRFREGLARFAETRPVHGECGGFMALGERLQDAEGTWHRMMGLLPHTTSFAVRRLSLGYREAKMLATTPAGPCGATVRGHEFHYATELASGGAEPLALLWDAQGSALGAAGGRRGNVTGSFFHVIAACPA